EGAREAGRPVPPLVLHAPVCVHEDIDQVRTAVREQMGYYPETPFYYRMFADAGYPEAQESLAWSDRMIDAVVLSGGEETVTKRLLQLFDWGAGEVLVSVVAAGPDREASWERTVSLLAQVAKTL
ncbi:MAG: hypothetical protein ACE5KI_04930, partial [Dehalococcoidia bacterium]